MLAPLGWSAAAPALALSAVCTDEHALLYAPAGVFAAARALAPSVVCIDELDALAPARGGSAEGGASAHHAAEPAEDMSARVVTTLLTEMDGLSSGGQL